KGLNQVDKALGFYERVQLLNDSLQIEETARKFQEMEYEKIARIDSLAQVEEKRLVQEAHVAAIRKKEQARNISFVIGGLILLIAGGLYSRLQYIRKSKVRLQQEKDRSENLLLNILPEEIANELKEKGKSMARDFELVSILFSDFIGFTEASAKLSAHELVTEINACFETFDGIMDKYGIEKIKTIGDAYMAAGGLPVPTKDSVRNTILAALEMQSFILNRKVALNALGKHAFQMRIGIHTGPVVAGIVGVKKFQYDIWGDTVNTANRMESKGEVGKVNISQATFELLKDDKNFVFESRGKIEAKGKGEIEMYFVERATL
ncbi:MAG: adenylate/guanylate cyclase domain-containing protein, partial [Maribacter sp.]